MRSPLFIILCLPLFLLAQPNMQRDSSIVVKVGGNPLKFPWAGGLNFTNWGVLDLNNDGYNDLLVFDKSGSKIRTFINDRISNQASYTHNSWYEDKFSFLSSWFTTYDFNKDGKVDIFTYSAGCGGISCYRNDGNLQFTPMGYYGICGSGNYNYYLRSDYASQGGITNIPDNGVGIPGLTDMDSDGDMDIVVFDIYAANVEYHQNQSVQNGYSSDSLQFKMVDKCWGKFNEGLCQCSLDVCPYPIKPHDLNETGRVMHAGSGMMCIDADGDGLIDLIEGDISCDSVFYMSNKGIVADAHMVSYTSKYPPSKPISISIFPSPFYLDVNNDAKRDLVVGPGTAGSEDVNNQWLYTNAGTDNAPNFVFQKNNFIQESMIDLGEGSYPAFFDYEGDGDLDLLVGNFGYYNASGVDTSALAFFKNTGTTITPTFSLVTANFNNLSSLHLQNMSPAFGDLDGDGDPDLLIGDNIGQFSYFRNTAGVGNPAVFSSTPTANFGSGFLDSMDLGNKAYPQLIDLDRDGDLDIVSGSQNGKIAWYKNTGTITTPAFSHVAVTTSLGGINVTQATVCSNLGQSKQFIFSDNGTYKMLVGSECGNMFLYDNIDGNLGGSFHLINSNAFGIYVGEHCAPALADLNGDSRLDMMIGNYSGGLTFFRGLNTQYNDIASFYSDDDLQVYPNPASTVVNIELKNTAYSGKKIRITDITGRVVKEMSSYEDAILVETGSFSNGMYVLDIQLTGQDHTAQKNLTRKLIIAHE